MQSNRSRFSLSHFSFSAAFIVAAAAAVLFSMPSPLLAQQQVTEPPYISGQTLTAKGFIQVALDAETGKTVFILTPDKAPAPTHTSTAAQAPIYLIAYPDLPGSVPADHLDCTVTNCKGLNVLPMPVAAYGVLPGNSPACKMFNHGNPCSPVEGHDHMVGTPFTGGDFNVAWHKVLVVFTALGIQKGANGRRISTLSQLQSDYMNGYVKEMSVPNSSFNCSLVPEKLYYEGTPVSVSYPNP